VTRLVTIGLPVRNGESRLRTALDSLLSQTYEHLELVAIDNASTDATPEILREYAARDTRMRVERLPTPLGVQYNRLIQLASGDYFLWGSYDDYWDPQMVARCVEVLDADPNVVLANPAVELIDPDDRPLERLRDEIDTRGMSVGDRCLAVVWNIAICHAVYGVFRTKPLQAVGGFKEVWGGEIQLLVELSLRGTIATVPEPLFHYRMRPGEVPNNDAWNRRMLTFFDPAARARKAAMTTAELLRECRDVTAGAVLDADLSPREKAMTAAGILACFEIRFGVPLPLHNLRQHLPARSYVGLLPIVLRREAEGGLPTGILE
jgi:hypothetical protein